MAIYITTSFFKTKKILKMLNWVFFLYLEGPLFSVGGSGYDDMESYAVSFREIAS